ncbi:hypothetical protein GQ457_12G008800 [Hibiscus cannabinus]
MFAFVSCESCCELSAGFWIDWFVFLVPMAGDDSTSSDVAESSISKVSKTFTNKKINIVLDETNFLLWKQQILLAVRSHRLEKLLVCTLKAPPTKVRSSDGQMVENEDHEVFVAQDSARASWLLSMISAHLLPQFVGAETALEIWSAVLKYFASRSTTTVMSLHYRLRSLKKGSLSMRAFVSQVKEVCDALASCGSPISELEQIATILNGVPIEYQPFVAVITANRDPYSLDEAISILFDAETQLTSFATDTDFSSNLNMAQVTDYAQNSDRNKNQSSQMNKSYRQSFGQRGRGRTGPRADSSTKDSSSNAVNLCAYDANSSGYSCSCAGSGSQEVSGDSNAQVNLCKMDKVSHGSASLFNVVPVVPGIVQVLKSVPQVTQSEPLVETGAGSAAQSVGVVDVVNIPAEVVSPADNVASSVALEPDVDGETEYSINEVIPEQPELGVSAGEQSMFSLNEYNEYGSASSDEVSATMQHNLAPEEELLECSNDRALPSEDCHDPQLSNSTPDDF